MRDGRLEVASGHGSTRPVESGEVRFER
jgi:hypothetical protein